jgi:hypothetical protein
VRALGTPPDRTEDINKVDLLATQADTLTAGATFGLTITASSIPTPGRHSYSPQNAMRQPSSTHLMTHTANNGTATGHGRSPISAHKSQRRQQVTQTALNAPLERPLA